ncbi:MAG TPA: hypothetical protein DDZ84_09340, partial [Firmicutes bacterium]|nr:hypothetical protein [Bacillota bacterium]
MQEASVAAALKTFDGSCDEIAGGDVVYDYHGFAGRMDHVDEDFCSVMARQTVEEHSRTHDVE